MSKVADYLLWLWETMKLSVSAIKAHRSMLSTVLRFELPEFGKHHVLRDLIWSFAIKRPHRPPMPPIMRFGYCPSACDVLGLQAFGVSQLKDVVQEKTFLVGSCNCEESW